MIPVGDARAIVAGLDPSRLVRMAYRAVADTTPPTGREGVARGGISAHPYTVACVALDLQSGKVQVLSWHPGDVGPDPMDMPRRLIALAWADTALVEKIDARSTEGCALAPSREVLEECAARDASADAIGVIWGLVESQLKRSYGERDTERRATGGEERR